MRNERPGPPHRKVDDPRLARRPRPIRPGLLRRWPCLRDDSRGLARRLERPPRWRRHPLPRLPRRQVRRREHLRHPRQRRIRDTRPLQFVVHLEPPALARPRRKVFVQLIQVAHPLRDTREPWVRNEFRVANHLAQLDELVVQGRMNPDPPVARRQVHERALRPVKPLAVARPDSAVILKGDRVVDRRRVYCLHHRDH